MKYNNHLNYRDRRRVMVRLRFIYSFLTLVALGGLVYLYFSYIKDDPKTGKDTSSVTTAVIVANTGIYNSEYFQFQAKETLQEVPNESTSNKFVYRNFHNKLLEFNLTIYVNQIPADLKPNRVVASELITDPKTTRLKVDGISDFCGKKTGQSAKNNIQNDFKEITLDTVNFNCYVQENPYNAIVGKKDGGTNITMKRPDGTTAVYTIYFEDLRAIPDPNDFTDIVSSFQTR